MSILTKLRNSIRNPNLKNGILYTAFSFINSGIGFILLLILAKYLTPEDYGYLNLFTIFVTLLSLIISLSTASYIPVAFFRKDIESLRQIILVTFIVSFSVTLLVGIIFLFAPSFVQNTIGVPIIFLWIGLFICLFTVFNNVNLDIWRLEERPAYYGIYSISFAISNFALTFGFIVGLNEGWQGRVYAWGILATVYFIISVVFLIKRKYIKLKLPSRSIFNETLIYSLPLLPHSVSFWLKSGLDRYIINFFYDQSLVGYYSFAMNLAAIITMVGTAFNATNSVYIYKKLKDGYSRVRYVLSRQTKLMTLVFLVISCFVILFSYSLIKFLLTQYNESIVFIIPLCLSGFFQCLYLLWVNYLFYYKKTKGLMAITVSTAILQVCLSLLLTRYSPIYTAYISMSVTAITMVAVQIYAKKTLNSNAIYTD